MDKTPFQSARDSRRPYIRLVIDTRHLKGVTSTEAGGCVVRHAGKVEFEGAVGAEQLAAAQALMRSMVDGEK
jgi:hypothetical protein